MDTIQEYTNKWRALIASRDDDPDAPEDIQDKNAMNFKAAKTKFLRDAENVFQSAWYQLNREYDNNEKNLAAAEYEKRKLIRSAKLTERDTTPEIEAAQKIKMELCDRALELQKRTKAVEILISAPDWTFYPDIFYKLTAMARMG